MNKCAKCNKIIGHPDTKCTTDMCDVKDWCPCCDDIMQNKLKNLEDGKNNHLVYKRPYMKSKTVREICYYLNGHPYDVICRAHYDTSHFKYCKCGEPFREFVDNSRCTEDHCEQSCHEPLAILHNDKFVGLAGDTCTCCCCGECVICDKCDANGNSSGTDCEDNWGLFDK